MIISSFLWPFNCWLYPWNFWSPVPGMQTKRERGKRLPSFPSLLFISPSLTKSHVLLGVACTESSHLKPLLSLMQRIQGQYQTHCECSAFNWQGTVRSTAPWQQTQVGVRASDHRPDPPGMWKQHPRPPASQALCWELREAERPWTRSQKLAPV